VEGGRERVREGYGERGREGYCDKGREGGRVDGESAFVLSFSSCNFQWFLKPL